MNRRGILRRSLLAGAALGAVCDRAAAADSTGGLRTLAAARGLLYGAYLDLHDPKLGAELKIVGTRECGLLVSSRTDWTDLEPEQGDDDFASADADYGWSAEHGLKFQGHCLVWGEMTPRWFPALPDGKPAETALRRHVASVCRHFAGRAQSWIVVNEAIATWSGRPDGLRRQAFLDKIGPQYIDIAFAAARENDAKARLVYNDFGVEVETPEQTAKRAALLTLLDGLLKRKVPVDTVGLQSHLYYEQMPHFNETRFAGFLKELSDRGLEIMISEMDVVDRGAPSDTARRDAEIGAIYRRYLDVALANPAAKTVITWGITDRDCWDRRSPNPETKREDGLPPRPLPLDDDYRPKPAYFAMADAFRAAPKR